MTNGDGKIISHFSVIMKNVLVLVKWPILIAGIVVVVMVLSDKKWKWGKLRIKDGAIYFIIAVIPFIWYVVSGRHSYIHYWFIYRELCITVFALLTGIVKIWDHREISDRKEKR